MFTLRREDTKKRILTAEDARLHRQADDLGGEYFADFFKPTLAQGDFHQ
ncbi:MAG: hypothetical protein HY089_12395 [Ignavibacteriales bacterium]|nr:hypothetical protein [Ignavibacteriales bacterium]